jgi:hypothetical protein
MTLDEIVELAKKAGGSYTSVCCGHGDYRDMYTFEPYKLEVFAKMLWEKGFDSGASVASGAIQKQIAQLHDAISLASNKRGFKARVQDA